MREPRCGFIAAFHQRFGTYDLQNYLRREKEEHAPRAKCESSPMATTVRPKRQAARPTGMGPNPRSQLQPEALAAA